MISKVSRTLFKKKLKYPCVDHQYKQLVNFIDYKGNEWEQTRSALCLSEFGYLMQFDMKKLPFVTTKKLALRPVVGELLWFMNGETSIADLKYRTFGDRYSQKKTIWTPDFDRWSKTKEYKDYISLYGVNEKSQPLGLVYGHQWGKQLQSAIDTIRNNPSDRRILVDAWNIDDLKYMALPPCHYSFQFYVKGDSLDLIWNQRSVDVGLGLPFNIASYAILLCIVAKMTNKKPRFLKGSLGNVHIYDNSYKAIKSQMKKIPYECLDFVDLDIIKNGMNLVDLKKMTADDILPYFKNYVSHDKVSIEVKVG